MAESLIVLCASAVLMEEKAADKSRNVVFDDTSGTTEAPRENGTAATIARCHHATHTSHIRSQQSVVWDEATPLSRNMCDCAYFTGYPRGFEEQTISLETRLTRL